LRDRDVVITGIGLVTPIGQSLIEFGRALFDGAVGFEAVPSRNAPALPGARVRADLGAGLARGEALLADRCTQLALLASSRALEDAGWAAGAADLQRCGTFVGCGAGPSEASTEAYAVLHRNGRMPGLALLRCLPGGAAVGVAIRHGLRGPTQSYASACASSTMAIGEAMRAIRHGYLDMALAGGTEAPFGEGTVKAWEALRVLAPLGDDPAAACRPFDHRRRGLVLGEGAVFFVLESAERAQARSATVYARLAGYGAAGDAHHWTEPSARGQMRAMAEAIVDAGLAPRDIGAINAHGTGTPVGDAVEAESITAVFGSGETAPAVSSTKAAHGHLLGASGAIELAAAIGTLQRGSVPPTRNLDQTDAGNALKLVRGDPVPLREGSAVLSNSFAFGGSNACLVITSAEA
jgi:3-oxoacyl-[acyl-carrier-protein] synthase II